MAPTLIMLAFAAGVGGLVAHGYYGFAAWLALMTLWIMLAFHADDIKGRG